MSKTFDATKWQKERRAERRAWAKRLLGGRCAVCGSVNELEFDHIDKETKKYTISEMFSSAMPLLLGELKKCQLLCGKHHNRKTKKELSGRIPWNKGVVIVTHGSNTMYKAYGCRCEGCREAHKIVARVYRKNALIA